MNETRAIANVQWGVLWHSENQIDGVTEHLCCEDCVPVLFRTRREARDWITKHFDYIKHRPDLRKQPHGWRMPRPVRVTITPKYVIKLDH